MDTFISSNVLIPRDGKCCNKHLNRKNTFHKKCFNSLEIVSNNSVLSKYEIEMLLINLRDASKFTILEKFSKPENITEDECKRFTGLNKDQFDDMVSCMSSLKNFQVRNKAQALAVYLFWLKTGLDYRTIATLFSIDNFQMVGEFNSQVRKSLLRFCA